MATDFRKKEALSDLTDRIVDSYEEIGTINHLGHCPLPNAQEVISIVNDIKEVLYPGYRRRQNLHLGNVAYYVGDLIDSLHDRLTTQIARSLRWAADVRGEDTCSREKIIDFEAARTGERHPDARVAPGNPADARA
ncbi:MAG: hypothetical protein R3B90_20260 [Planctomycetaceae bacterium]